MTSSRCFDTVLGCSRRADNIIVALIASPIGNVRRAITDDEDVHRQKNNEAKLQTRPTIRALAIAKAGMAFMAIQTFRLRMNVWVCR